MISSGELQAAKKEKTAVNPERERERAALSATVVVSQKEKRLTRDLLGRKTRAREPKPEDEEDQGTQTTELS